MFSDTTQRLWSDGEKYYYFCRELIYSVAYTLGRYTGTQARNEREKAFFLFLCGALSVPKNK
jgi:hypothetical protein